MRFLGLDYGSKRIGVALSDPDGTMAFPIETIQVKPDGSHIKDIKAIIDAYQVAKLVVGLPYNMDGSIGDRAREVMRWGGQIEELLGIPVIFWDERLSTSEAHDMLIGINVKGRKRKSIVDKIAASIILKGYLDSENT
jgi:putative holliday junction resolvase